ncbi:MAG: RDD family protein [Promethearchaeota archaeon]
MSRTEALVQRQAPCADRCVAYIIDGIITSCLSIVIIGACYGLFKDGIRDGQSLGKGMMGLRVVNFTTGNPATLGSSCLRNLCSCCPILLLFTKGRRRFGDFIGGTIVIKDK